MVVEDDPDVLDALREVLEDQGYQTVGAENGKAALELLSSRRPKPGVILLDLMMPVMDGRAFCAAQQEDPVLKTIPVIVLTAQSHAAETAQQMGAVGFLRKPVKLAELLEAIESHSHG